MYFWLHLSSPSPSPLLLQSICFGPECRFDDRSLGNLTVDDFVAFAPLVLRKHVLRRINFSVFDSELLRWTVLLSIYLSIYVSRVTVFSYFKIWSTKPYVYRAHSLSRCPCVSPMPNVFVFFFVRIGVLDIFLIYCWSSLVWFCTCNLCVSCYYYPFVYMHMNFKWTTNEPTNEQIVINA